MRAAVASRRSRLNYPNELARTLRRRGGIGRVMNNQIPKYVTQARASLLLGMPEAELDRIAKESGVGHVERAGDEEETYFTYEELQRIFVLAGRQIEAVH
jgi:hypothetical protein